MEIWFFEKINKINKLLARVIEKKEAETQITNYRSKTEDITRYSKNIYKVGKQKKTNLHNKSDNMYEID